jgi:hypothetical protein
MINNMWPHIQPNAINVDYEIGIHNAIRAGPFAGSKIQSCLFHLVQNLKKHLSQAHLLGRYSTDLDFALKCRMITSIAFVPEVDVAFAFAELETHFENDDLEPILEWFSTNYIGRLRANGTRAEPLFPITVWNVYSRTLENADRTNNHAEACHKKLQHTFGVAHPSLWHFIDVLKTVQKVIFYNY